MAASPPVAGLQHAPQVPRLLVELPSWPRVFFGNLRDLVLPRRLPPLSLRSAPAPFWPDVFVNRPLPWSRFLQSGVYHVIAGAALLGLARILALQPQARVMPMPAFDHSQIVYYQPAEYLPPLDTRAAASTQAAKPDPEFSRQPIISVPREADNHSQTIVTPPSVKLRHDVRMPNVVAWSDNDVKPRLAIPAAPLSPAAEVTRLAPALENSVAPPPDRANVAHQRNLPTLQDAVTAPPSDVQSARMVPAAQALQPALIAPPSSLENSPSQRLGAMDIAPAEVIAPAPQLPVADQRAVAGGRGATLGAPQIAPPPPALAASAGSGSASGAAGRLVALNLHPSVEGPSTPPAGNRRGAFTATPEGHAGASGSPGSAAGSAILGGPSNSGTGSDKAGAAGNSKTGDLPSGLYVAPTGKPSPATGDPATNASQNSVNPNLVASVRPPRITSARPMQPDSAVKLSEAERAVFGSRRFYSVTLNMPNLNSAGGSWIIRFAEFSHDLSSRDQNASAQDLSQPMATRKVDPAYPIQLMRENVHGTVILYAVIRADGTVGNVKVLRGVDERLDRYASEAVQQWKFEPATKNGTPVDVEATFQIPFRPARVGTNF